MRGSRALAAGLGLAMSVGVPSTGRARVPPPILRTAPSDSLDAAESAQVEGLLDDLKQAEDAASEDPEAGLEQLRQTLDRFAESPALVSRSEDAAEDRCFAMLTVAAALLEKKKKSEATALIDELIRIARGDHLPIDSYDSAVRKLHDERAQAPELDPVGSVAVRCTTPCRVILDEREAGSGTAVDVSDIPLGSHRLYIEAERGGEEPTTEPFVLTSEEPQREFAFGPPGGGDEVLDDDGPKRRRLPRWAGVTGVVLGIAMLGAGVALLVIDETCPDGSDPRGPMPCDNVFDTVGPGAALTLLGGGALIGFSVALGVGESRQRRASENSAMLNYTVRF